MLVISSTVASLYYNCCTSTGNYGYSLVYLLTLALTRGEWSASRPGPFIQGERAPGTHWIGGWVGLRAGLADSEK
jgi:hypothetical protein